MRGNGFKFWVESGSEVVGGNTPEEAINNARIKIVKKAPGWEDTSVGALANAKAEPLVLPVDEVEHWLPDPKPYQPKFSAKPKEDIKEVEPTPEPTPIYLIQLMFVEQPKRPSKRSFLSWLRRLFR